MAPEQITLAEVAGGRRREWWAGFLDSYYKIALPLDLRQTPITFW